MYRNLKVGEVARILVVGPTTVQKMVDTDVLRGFRVNTHRRVPEWEVRKYLKQHNMPAFFILKPPKQNEVLTTGQVATFMGCSTRVVCQLFDTGQIPGWRSPYAGTDRRFHSEDVLQYFQEGQMSGAIANLELHLKS